MSATLTWASSGNITKTGTTAQLFLDDLDTVITSKSGDASFSWQTAGKNSTGASPLYLVLSRKGGSAGRILIVVWTSAPAANNVAILDQSPSTNQIYIAWFPAGTANTPSNLTGASGTIMGVDTGCVKVAAAGTVAAMYGASLQLFYMDSAEGFVLGSANPATPQTYMCGAGAVLVDAADVAYDATFGFNTNSAANFGVNTPPIPWLGTFSNAGNTIPYVATNYGSANRRYYMGLVPSGIWANQAVGSQDVLTDNSVNKTWFVAPQLLGQTKGEGFVLKFRQFGWGPGTTGPFSAYSTTGPVVAARQFCNQSSGSTGFPWFTNFKI